MAHRVFLLITLLFSSHAFGESPVAPWGSAKAPSKDYPPQKVLYDLDSDNIKDIENIIDRISLLNKVYGADPFDSRITVVIHGEAIPFFSVQSYQKHRELINRIQQFSLQETIEFKLCAAAAKSYYDLGPKDFHSFIELVPMADAEIIHLQKQHGFAYMR